MFSISTKKDSSFTVLGRVTAKNGSGAASPIPSEGNLVQQDDVSTITIRQINESGTVLNTETPTVSSVIHDTIQTSGVWGAISGGGNFEWDAPYGWANSASTFILSIEIDYAGGEQTVERISWRVWD